jgi:hypothetical protein
MCGFNSRLSIVLNCSTFLYLFQHHSGFFFSFSPFCFDDYSFAVCFEVKWYNAFCFILFAHDDFGYLHFSGLFFLVLGSIKMKCLSISCVGVCVCVCVCVCVPFSFFHHYFIIFILKIFHLFC